MASKKKLLVVCQHFWPENFRINDICDFFVEKGAHVDVLCGLPNYPSGKLSSGYSIIGKRRETHNGVSIRRVLEIPRGNNSNFRIFLNYLSFPFFSLFHLPRLLFTKYDKIYIYQLSPVYMGIAGILLGKLKRIETIMYILDLWPENLYSVLDVKSKLARKILESTSHWHYRHVDKIVTLTEKMRTKILEVTDLRENKVICIPQTCEKLYEQDVHDKELQERFSTGFNIVFAGNISPAQDLETVLSAAKMLRTEKVGKINWIIVGDGMSRKWLEGEVQKSGLANDFYFEGNKPMGEIPKYHTIADALLACLVSSDLLDATIPAKVMSYLAAGRPIVLAMDGEARRIVNSVGCGFAGPSGDARQLYRNIKELLAISNKERKAMGEKGREYHFKNFERNMNLKKMYNFIIN